MGSSVILVIQFPQRNADRAERDLDHRADRLSRELRSSAAGNWAVHWLAQKKPRCAKVGDCAFFVVIPRLGDGNIESLLSSYAKRHSMIWSHDREAS